MQASSVMVSTTLTFVGKRCCGQIHVGGLLVELAGLAEVDFVQQLGAMCCWITFGLHGKLQ